ncbi:hypothetical protein LXL04_037843 [Taraxacum kok-saghyz]
MGENSRWKLLNIFDIVHKGFCIAVLVTHIGYVNSQPSVSNLEFGDHLVVSPVSPSAELACKPPSWLHTGTLPRHSEAHYSIVEHLLDLSLKHSSKEFRFVSR